MLRALHQQAKWQWCFDVFVKHVNVLGTLSTDWTEASNHAQIMFFSLSTFSMYSFCTPVNIVRTLFWFNYGRNTRWVYKIWHELGSTQCIYQVPPKCCLLLTCIQRKKIILTLITSTWSPLTAKFGSNSMPLRASGYCKEITHVPSTSLQHYNMQEKRTWFSTDWSSPQQWLNSYTHICLYSTYRL